MNRRTARVSIGLLAVVCLGLVTAVVYPVSTSTPHASLPPDERFSVGDREAFSVDTRLVVDGETRLALEGTATADGAHYSRLNDSGAVSETYRSDSNSAVYSRLFVPAGEAADARRQHVEGTDDRTILEERSTDDGTVFIVRTNRSQASADELSGSASVFVYSLFVTTYERVDDPNDSDGTAVYEPEAGWFDEASAYRVSDPSGRVSVDSETGAVQSASVSWGLTQPADTYAHARLARLFGDQPQQYRLEYEFEPGASNVSRPAWVPDE